MSRRWKIALSVLLVLLLGAAFAYWRGPRAGLAREIGAVELPSELSETYTEYHDAMWFVKVCITSCPRVERIYVSGLDERATLEAVVGALGARGYDVTPMQARDCARRGGAEPGASLGVDKPYGCGYGRRGDNIAHYDVGLRRDGRVSASITIELN